MKDSAKILRCGLWGITAVCLFAPLPGFAQVVKGPTPTPTKSNTVVVKSPSLSPSPTPTASSTPASPTATKSGVKTDTDQNASKTPAGDGSSTGSTSGSPGTENSEKIKDLYLETLYQDIETATYYELVDWCKRLSLSDAGDRAALQSRLYEFFKLEPASKSPSPAPTQTPTPSGGPTQSPDAQVQNADKLIQITSAKSTEYFKIEEINEEYLILQGDVVIKFQDNKDGTKHSISAQRVMVNQTQKLLTAVGDIHYSLEKPGEKPEVFTGESFVFNIDSWAGGFVDARGEKESDVADDKKVKFLYQGERLSRLKNDIIILQKGTITSCDETDDPHWSIKAQKIWVLAPGEWAVRDAILHVGRVPVFYLPFFFKPGDDFFFHPVIGYRDREGFFIQTTTYLLGQKKDKDSAFSFLRASEDKEKEYELQLNGLFLKKGNKKDKKTDDTRILKIIADFYSRLGGFTGLVLDLSPAWQLKGGLGFSRNIYPRGSSYSPYEEDTLTSKWNTTPLWGLTLPFRFGFDTNFKFNLLGSAVNVNGNLQLFSDPFFEEDFYDRSEDIDWLKMMKGNDTVEANQTIQPTTSTAYDLVASVTQKNTIGWSLNSSINFPVFPPYLESLRLTNLNLGLTWYSSSNADNLSPSDPARQFYYPWKLRLPDNMNLQVSGTLLDWNSQKPPAASKPPTGEPADVKTGNDFGKGFSFPESNQLDDAAQTDQSGQTAPTPGTNNSGNTDTNQTAGQEPANPFLEPDTLEDLPVEFGRSLASSFKINYSLTPYFTLEDQFDTDNWRRPQDVNFAAKYLELMHSGNYFLNYNYNFWGALLKGNGSFQFSERYQKRLYSAPDDIWPEAYDKQNSDLYLNGTTTVSLQPLLDLKYFSSSSIDYNISSDLYRYAYNTLSGSYETKYVDWNTTYIKTHKIRATLNFTPDIVTHYLSFSATLPPLDGDYSGTLNFTLQNMDFFSLNTNITSGYKETQDVWTFSPLVVTETFRLNTLLSLSEMMTWDLNSQAFIEARTNFKTLYLPFWSKYLLEGDLILKPNLPDPRDLLTTTLNIQNFAATFRAQMMDVKKLDLIEGEWVIDGSKGKDFLPQSLRLTYFYDVKNLKFWKNRITSTIHLETNWDIALQEFTNTQFKFTCNWNFEINDFLTFGINVASHNYRTYLYFPDWANRADMEWINPVIDLLKSFNFFSEQDRRNSNFKLDTVGINLTHRLHDWDLKLTYSGKQDIVTGADGISKYEWKPDFTLSLEWNPIPELKHEISQENGILNLRG